MAALAGLVLTGVLGRGQAPLQAPGHPLARIGILQAGLGRAVPPATLPLRAGKPQAAPAHRPRSLVVGPPPGTNERDAIEPDAIEPGAGTNEAGAGPGLPPAAVARVGTNAGEPGTIGPDAIEPGAGPEGGAPRVQDGITFRRDPLVPPFVERDRWQELLLSVTVNGYLVSDGTFFIEDPASGRLAVELEVARRWRIAIDEARALTFQGVPFYPVDAIEGVEIGLDRKALALALQIPPETFEPYVVDAQAREAVPPAATWGGFLDYDLLLAGGDAVEERLDGLAELGVFTPYGVALSSFKGDDLLGRPGLTRLETTFSRDFPERRASLTLGDGLALGGAFGSGLRFGGVHWHTDFGLDPGFVPFPLPAIGGLAEQRSLVEVLVDNFSRRSETVPPGPFEFNNLPVVTGSGEVQLKVTDLLGRERLITRSYYVSPRLLRPGLHDYSYALGFERRSYAVDGFDYGQPIASLTHRYGFGEAFTGEAHAEATPDRASLALGGAFGLGAYGLVSGGVGASGDEDAGGGVLGQLAYEYGGRAWNAGLGTRYTSDGFRQFGDGGVVRRTDQLSLGLNLADKGRLGLLLLNRDLAGQSDTLSASLSYSLPVGPGSLIVNAAQVLNPTDEAALTATYALPLGQRRSVAARVERRPDGYGAYAQYHQGRDRTDLGLDWRVAGEVGETGGVEAGFDYQTGFAGATLDLDRYGGDLAARAGVNGSLVWLGGGLHASRRLGRGFGLVDLPGFADVRVYVDNREVGRTDGDGRLLLPRLRPYEPNKVSFAVDDLPIEARIGATELVTAPTARSGVLLRMAVDDAAVSVARFLDRGGAPLPAGLRLTDAGGRTTALVAKEGLAQVEGPQDGVVRVEGEGEGRRFACTLPPLGDDRPLPDRGEVRCEG